MSAKNRPTFSKSNGYYKLYTTWSLTIMSDQWLRATAIISPSLLNDLELGLPTTVVVVLLLDQHGLLEASSEDRTAQPKVPPLPPPPQDAPRL